MNVRKRMASGSLTAIFERNCPSLAEGLGQIAGERRGGRGSRLRSARTKRVQLPSRSCWLLLFPEILFAMSATGQTARKG